MGRGTCNAEVLDSGDFLFLNDAGRVSLAEWKATHGGQGPGLQGDDGPFGALGDFVGGGVSSAVNAVGSAASTVGKAVANTAKDVVNVAIKGAPAFLARFASDPRGAIMQAVHDIGEVKIGPIPLGATNLIWLADAAARKGMGQQLYDSMSALGPNGIPGGPAAQNAAKFISSLAQGNPPLAAAIQTGQNAMLGDHPLNLPDPLSVASKALPSISALPGAVNTVANALLKQPTLRSLPISDVASRLGVPVENVKQAVASIAGTAKQIGQSPGAALVSKLMPMPGLANQVSPDHTLDEALSALGSNVAPVKFSPNAIGKAVRKVVPGIRWRSLPAPVVQNLINSVPAARRLPPSTLSNLSLRHFHRPSEASGLDSSGTQYKVESGDTLSKIAQKLTGSASRYPEMATQNKLANPDLIRVGQVLVLPPSWVKAPAATSSPVPTVIPVTVTSTAASAMPQIQQGSTGAAVVTWQKIVGVTADGQFGPQTAAATKAWQSAHGLVADGIVGPKTWAAALGSAASSAPSLPTALPTSVPLPIPAGTTITAPPGGIQHVQIMLAAWAAKTGQSNPSDFGTNPQDLMGADQPRYHSALASFQLYARNTMARSGLRTDGVLDDASYQALVDWTSQSVGLPGSASPSTSLPIPGATAAPPSSAPITVSASLPAGTASASVQPAPATKSDSFPILPLGALAAAFFS